MTDSTIARAESREHTSGLAHYESMLDESQALARLEAQAEEEIREAFALRGKAAMERIAVPEIQYRNGMRVGAATLASAFLEVIHDGSVDKELLAMLEASDCAFVAKLRAAVCEKWVRSNAADIAECRA